MWHWFHRVCCICSSLICFNSRSNRSLRYKDFSKQAAPGLVSVLIGYSSRWLISRPLISYGLHQSILRHFDFKECFAIPIHKPSSKEPQFMKYTRFLSMEQLMQILQLQQFCTLSLRGSQTSTISQFCSLLDHQALINLPRATFSNSLQKTSAYRNPANQRNLF